MLFGCGRNDHWANTFTVASHIKLPQPEPVHVPEAEDYSDEEEVVIRPKKKRHRLPGAKLLKSLARERERERREKKSSRRSRRRHKEGDELEDMASRVRQLLRD